MQPTSPPVDFSRPIDSKAVGGKTAPVTRGHLKQEPVPAESGAIVIIADLNSKSGEAHAAELRSKKYR